MLRKLFIGARKFSVAFTLRLDACAAHAELNIEGLSQVASVVRKPRAEKHVTKCLQNKTKWHTYTMEYQELELGIAKKLSEKTKRHFSYQLVINGTLLFWMLCCSAGFLYNYYQVQVLHWHLNATHVRVRELERWQRHMCSVRHYNCPEVSLWRCVGLKDWA